MLGFHERRKIKRYIFSHLSMLVLLFVIIMLSVSVWGIRQKALQTWEKRDTVASEHSKLSERSKDLSKRIGELETQYGVEAELRERFDVGAPGESLLIIVDPELPPVEEVPPQETGFWAWFKGWFR